MTRRRLFLFAALCAGVLPLSASAQVQQATVVVDGLACPFCAYSLEKRLKAIDGVQDLSINISDGTAVLAASAGGSIDLASIPAAVKSAGFTARSVEVRATGRIEDVDNGATLVSPAGETLCLLAPNELLEAAVRGAVLEVAGAALDLEHDEGEDDLPVLVLTSLTDLTQDESEK